jgi:hypothetical protein
MEYINISRKNIYTGKVFRFSSESDKSTSAANLLSEHGFWRTEKRDVSINEFFIIDYEKPVVADFIEILPSKNGASSFPKAFRIEYSLDAEIWTVLITEKDFDLEDGKYSIIIPLTALRFVKFFITSLAEVNSKYYSEISSFQCGIKGVSEFKASSSQSEELTVNNLLNIESKNSWESAYKNSGGKEDFAIDLGAVYNINRIILQSSSYGFPENFHLDASVDRDVWNTVIEEKNFKSENLKKYSWNIELVSTRFIKFIAKTIKQNHGSHSVKIAGIEIFAAPFNFYHSHNLGELTLPGSVFQAGVVRFAKDGESIHGRAVQSNDSRLKDASTIFKGIVQFAEDGESKKGLAVQASDPRLHTASDNQPGIVRLAYDRESKEGSVVQGNDSRLKLATENNFGIVKLCPDGVISDNSVVAGNDSRLLKATTESFGICKIAKDAEVNPNCVVQANDRRLKDATTVSKGIVELAEDGEVKSGTAVQGDDKRLKDATEITKGIVRFASDGEKTHLSAVQGSDKRLMDATTVSKGIIELAEDGEEKSGAAIQSNDRRLKDATTISKGIIQLAADGEEKIGVAVQSNDRRLKEATEKIKGNMRFASDGEESALSAVQGNDSRLKDATEISKGIGRFARDGEISSLSAVQGSDKRLKDATTLSKGIVELAENGEVKEGAVIQSNDKRLFDATEKTKGIMRFAINGEDTILSAVQGNDKRLKDATTVSKGIVELAADGEVKEGSAVQSNDKRLKNATEISAGIMRFAANGEENAGSAVQGNDRRLNKGTDSSYGILKFAKNNESCELLATQANDIRLSDPREPLPHEHKYAPVVHSFNSHDGTVSISDERSELFNGITPPSDNSAVVYSKNTSKSDGAIGVAGISGIDTESVKSYGILGHAPHIGVRGQATSSTGKGCGVLGVSRFSPGGVFSSEHGYSLIVEGYGNLSSCDETVKLNGNGDALLVNGKSVFNGSLLLNNSKNNQVSSDIAELFRVDSSEYVSPGDVLIVSPIGDGILSRCSSEYSKAVVGIVSGNPSILLAGNSSDEKLYPVSVAGKTLCRIDARNNPILPGDLIVTSNTPGCGMKGNIDSINKIGTVIGKALGRLDEGIGEIPVLICHL